MIYLYICCFNFCILEALIGMGYSRAEIEDSLTQCKYDDVFATYLLLGRKNSDVSFIPFSIYKILNLISMSGFFK